jgi:hypothetical protein
MANLSGIRQDSAKWNPHQAKWYVTRPLIGAIFGAIGYLIYIAIVQASITTTSSEKQAHAGPSILGYVIAFTLGYREETFRDLLQRVTDLLVSAGGGDVEPPSQPAQLDLCPGAAEDEIKLQWRPSTDNVGVTGYNVYRDYWFLASVRIDSNTDRYPRRQTTGEREDRRNRDEPHNDDPQRENPRPGWVTFSDRSVDTSKIFLYSVTALDAAGNESKPAGPIRVGPRQRSRPSSPHGEHDSSKEGPTAK